MELTPTSRGGVVPGAPVADPIPAAQVLQQGRGTQVVAPTVGDVFATHRLPMLRLAVLLVDDRASAEDVVQDAFAGLHRAWPTLTNPDAVAAYLRVSVVNGCRSVLRRRRTARAWVPPHAPPGPSAEESLLLSEERREVLDAVRALPRRQREVLVLRYWSGLDEAGIAQALGISRGTVKSTASRGLLALQRALATEVPASVRSER